MASGFREALYEPRITKIGQKVIQVNDELFYPFFVEEWLFCDA